VHAFQLTGGPEACIAARSAVVACDGQLPAAVRDDVLLLVTELVANAVRHAGVGPDQYLRIELRRWPRRIRRRGRRSGRPVRPRSSTSDLGRSGWLGTRARRADRRAVGCRPRRAWHVRVVRGRRAELVPRCVSLRLGNEARIGADGASPLAGALDEVASELALVEESAPAILLEVGGEHHPPSA
jgi:hypothetical protein